MLLTYTELFVQAWMRDCFLDDYGLRQACVKQGVQANATITVADLVIVDIEGVTAPRECKKGKISQL